MTALLTEPEAADILHLSPRTLRLLRSQGEIRYIRPSPRKVLYSPDDLAEYIAKQTRQDNPSCPKAGALPDCATPRRAEALRFPAIQRQAVNGTGGKLRQNTARTGAESPGISPNHVQTAFRMQIIRTNPIDRAAYCRIVAR